MAVALWNTGTSNAISTTLSGGITASDTEITLTSASGLQAPGVITIDRVNTSGTRTPSAKEYISFTGISTNTLTGCTRGRGGSTGQTHQSGAIVEECFTGVHWNDLIEFLEVSHHTDGSINAANASITTARIQTLNTITATASTARITLHLNASGASITGNFPIHPVWVMTGTQSATALGQGKPLIMPQPGVFQFFAATLRLPPSAASLVLDINKNGTSIFTTGTRPTITGGGTFVSTASIATKAFAAGDVFTVDVAIGATNATDLTVIGRG